MLYRVQITIEFNSHIFFYLWHLGSRINFPLLNNMILDSLLINYSSTIVCWFNQQQNRSNWLFSRGHPSFSNNISTLVLKHYIKFGRLFLLNRSYIYKKVYEGPIKPAHCKKILFYIFLPTCYERANFSCQPSNKRGNTVRWNKIIQCQLEHL